MCDFTLITINRCTCTIVFCMTSQHGTHAPMPEFSNTTMRRCWRLCLYCLDDPTTCTFIGEYVTIGDCVYIRDAMVFIFVCTCMYAYKCNTSMLFHQSSSVFRTHPVLTHSCQLVHVFRTMVLSIIYLSSHDCVLITE